MGLFGVIRMNVKELIEELSRFNDDDEVLVYFIWDGDSVLDGVVNTSRNGNAIQLNCETVYEE